MEKNASCVWPPVATGRSRGKDAIYEISKKRKILTESPTLPLKVINITPKICLIFKINPKICPVTQSDVHVLFFQVIKIFITCPKFCEVQLVKGNKSSLGEENIRVKSLQCLQKLEFLRQPHGYFIYCCL